MGDQSEVLHSLPSQGVLEEVLSEGVCGTNWGFVASSNIFIGMNIGCYTHQIICNLI